MPNLKLIGRLCLTEEGQIVYLPVSSDARYKEEVYQSDEPSGITVPLTPEEVKIAKEQELDLSLTGVITGVIKKQEAAKQGIK